MQVLHPGQPPGPTQNVSLSMVAYACVSKLMLTGIPRMPPIVMSTVTSPSALLPWAFLIAFRRSYVFNYAVIC